jgi:hypothetical protein
MNPDDAKLGALLRASRVSPTLPPRFQETVWRRIEDADAPKTTSELSWLDAAVALILRPRFAYATVAVLVLTGALLGTLDVTKVARHDAEARYVAIVAPNGLR